MQAFTITQVGQIFEMMLLAWWLIGVANSCFSALLQL